MPLATIIKGEYVMEFLNVQNENALERTPQTLSETYGPLR